MRIDSHQHFWKYDPERHSWLDESMRSIRKDFMPSDLGPILQKNGIEGCVLVQVDQTEAETELLLQLACDNYFIKGVVGWVDLLADNVVERLEYFSRNPLFKGVRHIVQGEADDFMLRGDFQKGIGALSQFNLTYDILIYPSQLPSALSLVQKFPKQKFVIDHIAKPAISNGLDEYWIHGMQALSTCKNVYCKVSGMVTETRNYKWHKDDFIPFMDIVVNAFGIDRILFGSDWPVCLVAAEYDEVVSIVEDYFGRFKKGDQDKVMGINTKEFYNIR
ncbi:L-fuconolactonase [Saonia flava]|uniref:L-fuconolactonase n=1 Tax=Saonia flava TaxID=523696 RepID=A0A846R131_9FLAO|nr:amidohydrolase family protein [Saonia flava]NJB72662.1 L-fuconolactonase [Saonia flava]